MKIEIEIDDDVVKHINAFLEMQNNNTQSAHGTLDLAGLVAMLLQDVALAVRRPGSWEGSKMGELLGSHGYPVHG